MSEEEKTPKETALFEFPMADSTFYLIKSDDGSRYGETLRMKEITGDGLEMWSESVSGKLSQRLITIFGRMMAG